MSTSIKIFLSYAHEDENLCKELEKHLSALKRQGIITTWYDRNVNAGSEWKREIDEHLNTAHIILLLLSPDFMASDYHYGIEMQRAMDRHKQASARVIPVILRPTDWQIASLEDLEALPKDAKPVTMWSSYDAAFLDITQGIRDLIEVFIHSSKSTQPSEVLIEVVDKKNLKGPLLYYCYISERKVEQILSQNQTNVIGAHTNTIGESGKNPGKLSRVLDEMFQGRGEYGKPSVAGFFQEQNKTIMTKLIAAMYFLEKQLGDLPLLIEKIQQEQLISPGAYFYSGEFSVSQYDEQLAYLESSLPDKRILKLSCSFKYFSEKDENVRFILHSGNAMFFAGEVKPMFQSLLYVLQIKGDLILGTPLFLGLPLESPLQL